MMERNYCLMKDAIRNFSLSWGSKMSVLSRELLKQLDPAMRVVSEVGNPRSFEGVRVSHGSGLQPQLAINR